MWRSFIHRWERYLSRKDLHRESQPFDWGFEYLNLQAPPSLSALYDFNLTAIANSAKLFHPAPLVEYSFADHQLQFLSGVRSPHPGNDVVTAKLFPTRQKGAAVVVLPQWNADRESHVSLCRMLQRFGITALRLTLPYHGERNPNHGPRADFMVSANLGRTIQATVQAVQDSIHCAEFLLQEGYSPIGIMGSSVGSCVSYLAYVHDERFQVGVFNHVSSYFGDVVWTGISTQHVREALEGHLRRDELHQAWAVISPNSYVAKLQAQRARARLFVSARYDLTFPPELSQLLFDEHDRCCAPYDVEYLPCGHYTTALWPFKYLDGYKIIQYFRKHLVDKTRWRSSSYIPLSDAGS